MKKSGSPDGNAFENQIAQAIKDTAVQEIIAGPSSFFAIAANGHVYELKAPVQNIPPSFEPLFSDVKVKQLLINHLASSNPSQYRLYRVLILGDDGSLYTTPTRALQPQDSIDHFNVDYAPPKKQPITLLHGPMKGLQTLFSFSPQGDRSVGFINTDGDVILPKLFDGTDASDKSFNLNLDIFWSFGKKYPAKLDKNVKKVACSLNHSLILLDDGTVRFIGYNNYGQLGKKTTENRFLCHSLTSIPSSKPIIDIAVSNLSSVLLDVDGKVHTSGWISQQQNSTDAFRCHDYIPNAIIKITAGHEFVVGLDEKNQLWGMGKLPATFNIGRPDRFTAIANGVKVLTITAGPNGLLYQTDHFRFYCTSIMDSAKRCIEVKTPQHSVQLEWSKFTKRNVFERDFDEQVLANGLRQCWLKSFGLYRDLMSGRVQQLYSWWKSDNRSTDINELQRQLPTVGADLEDMLKFTRRALNKDFMEQTGLTSPLYCFVKAVHDSPVANHINLLYFRNSDVHDHHDSHFKSIGLIPPYDMPQKDGDITHDNYQTMYRQYVQDFAAGMLEYYLRNTQSFMALRKK